MKVGQRAPAIRRRFMPLSPKRFRDDDTLARSVDDGYRMHRGERDPEAVKRLQLALFDPFNPQITRSDGIWGDRINETVIQFEEEQTPVTCGDLSSFHV
jgi:hypothetical protein